MQKYIFLFIFGKYYCFSIYDRYKVSFLKETFKNKQKINVKKSNRQI